MKEYTINLKKQLKAFSFMFYMVLFILAILTYYWYNNELDTELIGYFALFLVISFMPVIYLHLEYLNINHGLKISIDKENCVFYLFDKKKEVPKNLAFGDITKIVIYSALSIKKKSNFQLLPFENYHFARIYTRTEELIDITSLLMDDMVAVLSELEGIKPQFKFRFFATTLF